MISSLHGETLSQKQNNNDNEMILQPRNEQTCLGKAFTLLKYLEHNQ